MSLGFGAWRYSFGSIDEMGDGVFRKVRRELGVTAFGVNALALRPGRGQPAPLPRGAGRALLRPPRTGEVRLLGESFELGPAGSCTSRSTTPRRITSIGDEDLVMLVVGAKDGYVGRDGQLAPADAF